ncbi:MAG: hypothetical protein ACRC2T_10225, partial [Thermoguttaceae bacterium]
MTDNAITRSLDAVQRRYRFQCFIDSLAGGVFWTQLVALPFVILRLSGYLAEVSIWLPCVIALGFGLGVGALVGIFMPLDRRISAEKIDSHYKFKDRVLTAWYLLTTGAETPIAKLQLSDAAEYAAKVEPKAVIPYHRPKNFRRASGVILLIVGICIISQFTNTQQTKAETNPIDTLEAIAKQLDNELVKTIDELSKENPEEQALKELADEMQKLKEQLDQQTAEPKETLATLSQMESALDKAINEFNLEAMDASLQEIGEALSAAESTRSAGQELKEGNLGKALEELEKMDTSSMSKQERKAVSEQLKKASSEATRRNQKELSSSTQKMSECTESGNCEGSKESACEIAGMCKKQSLRKGICQSLGNKLALLSMCKSECAGAGSSCDKNGGNNTAKSNKGSQNWGTGAAGDPRTGQETNLDSNRQTMQVSGIQGAGPSEFETLKSSQGEEGSTSRS